MPGHDPGHDVTSPPVGLDWQGYIDNFVREMGSWTALADEFIRRASGAVDVPLDPQTVEKGLRRLAKREHRPGGQYGRWALRFLGVPSDVENWARWLAQYHSRFADLPTSLRLEQLRLWDRPPISESRLSAWTHVGMASVLHRLGDMDNCRRRLDLASKAADRAGAAAMLEVKLLVARIATDENRCGEAQRLFDEAADLLEDEALTGEDRACYHARLVGQRAYHLTKPVRGDKEDLEGALSLFKTIDEDPTIPFVCFRRNSGLAYCVWKLGDPAEGARLARRAAEFAGDGGFVRLRVMALNMLCRMVEADEGRELNERAARLAKQLEDEDLLRRVRHRGKSIGKDKSGTSLT